MKNKTEQKKYLRIAFFVMIGCTFLLWGLNHLYFQKQNAAVNKKIAVIVENVQEAYPEVSTDQIMKILLEDSKQSSEILKQYSVELDKDILVKDLRKTAVHYNVLSLVWIAVSMSGVMIVFLLYNRKKDQNIASITKCIEEINRKNYTLEIDSISEDELSILKSEIYKTTLMLKEQAENAMRDKKQLKDSLSDISHQLKTPLTSILILLDNLIEYPDMDEKTRSGFLHQIKVETSNIQFLVRSLLKLSNLDAGTVTYMNQKILLSALVEISAEKILPLCDLKNIHLNIEIQNDQTIVCDEMWQAEALSNIIKNSVEHSLENGVVDIIVDANRVYGSITIRDYGSGISKEDFLHIFERFYKGKSSDENSFGIGLALAKTILEKNGGSIQVESEEGKGTTFIIRYVQ